MCYQPASSDCILFDVVGGLQGATPVVLGAGSSSVVIAAGDKNGANNRRKRYQRKMAAAATNDVSSADTTNSVSQRDYVSSANVSVSRKDDVISIQTFVSHAH